MTKEERHLYPHILDLPHDFSKSQYPKSISIFYLRLPISVVYSTYSKLVNTPLLAVDLSAVNLLFNCVPPPPPPHPKHLD